MRGIAISVSPVSPPRHPEAKALPHCRPQLGPRVCSLRFPRPHCGSSDWSLALVPRVPDADAPRPCGLSLWPHDSTLWPTPWRLRAGPLVFQGSRVLRFPTSIPCSAAPQAVIPGPVSPQFLGPDLQRPVLSTRWAIITKQPHLLG